MKLKQLSMLLIAAIVVIFTGCSKDEEKVLEPTVEFIAGSTGYYTADATVDSGSVVNVIVLANKGKDGAKLDKFDVLVGSLTYTAESKSGLSADTHRDTVTYLISATTTLTIRVTDKDGKSASKNITFTKRSATQITTPISQTSRPINALNSYDLEGLTSQVGTTAPSNPGDFDLWYFNSTSTGGNLVSGGFQNNSDLTASSVGATWAGSTAVIIRSTTADYAAAATQDQSNLLTIFNNATDVPAVGTMGAGVRAKNVTAGQVYSVKTSSGKYALIKINSVSGTSVIMDYLIQN